ncbi:hypothetical protein Z052_00915 [Halorubrum sp. C191]|uniref:hypothetical protein n=1 Tax=Halorubrum sp. C191 TaxID=1383842 RepID=UPI000C08445C|nr:hypothetical protein [Halorubrum sp. C191]PHQ44027.1 hypothetical protein Z052_00915 [Halorubrum sp. C191]
MVFSDFEREFASNIFYPHINKYEATFEYEEWLQKFVMSVSWRLIVSELSEVDGMEPYHRSAFYDAEEIWREILTGNLSLSSDPFSHHIFFLNDVVPDETAEDLPDKWEFYINRGIDGTPILGKQTAIYFKFPQIICISCIQPPEDPEIKDTKIEQTGEIGPPQEIGPDWGTFLVNRAEKVTSRDVSESEQKKIKDRMLDDLERVAESESFETYIKKKERELANHNPLDYLNEACPICHIRHDLVEFLPLRPLMREEIERMDDKNEFVEGIYMQGELAIDGVSEDAVPTFILSTADWTKIVSLYTDVGWVVENHIDHPEDTTPREIGQRATEEKKKMYTEWVKEQSE